MQLKLLVVAYLASVTFAQLMPENVHDMPDPTAPFNIATAPPTPDDLQNSLLSEASARLSSFSSEGASQIASITSNLGAQASEISSKLQSVSSDIASKSSSYSAKYDATKTATDNQAAAQTGAMAIGALFGFGAMVANF